jgi:hypothetical protein
MELTLAQVGCRCGRRFAPLLQLLGVERGSRVSPGLARRAFEMLRDEARRSNRKIIEIAEAVTVSVNLLPRSSVE